MLFNELKGVVQKISERVGYLDKLQTDYERIAKDVIGEFDM